jgi:hypothetical protein
MPVSLSTLLEAIGESNLHALFFTQLLDLITERQITFQLLPLSCCSHQHRDSLQKVSATQGLIQTSNIQYTSCHAQILEPYRSIFYL